jgi:hypothetical protein
MNSLIVDPAVRQSTSQITLPAAGLGGLYVRNEGEIHENQGAANVGTTYDVSFTSATH